ncbi:HisA/HisF-related TIM barrel protein [Endozoicomonas sp. YOMI1]|uniref:HisA/HisF-related TIM barrel protein n=1 Tax=Endozoicomonas sp. YOMI1 TaxID=2828739 RepID=UPI0021497A0A|nr:HisA/HisF-related TIM barrel protein [Endozoicomonas sp. YOMI1]
MHSPNPVRLIAKVSIFNGVAFQTRQYQPQIYLGDPINICNVLSDQGCQEINLVFPHAPPGLDKIARILSVSRAPTAVGGYGTDIKTIENLMNSGAEKIIISDSLWFNPRSIEKLADHIGDQAISCSVDYRVKNGKRLVVAGPNRDQEIGQLEELVQSLPSLRFGEIILSCISSDGSRSGLDLDIVSSVSTTKSLLLSGGYNDESLENFSADGVVCSTAMFLYGGLNAPLTHYPNQYRVNASV